MALSRCCCSQSYAGYPARGQDVRTRGWSDQHALGRPATPLARDTRSTGQAVTSDLAQVDRAVGSKLLGPSWHAAMRSVGSGQSTCQTSPIARSPSGSRRTRRSRSYTTVKNCSRNRFCREQVAPSGWSWWLDQEPDPNSEMDFAEVVRSHRRRRAPLTIPADQKRQRTQGGLRTQLETKHQAETALRWIVAYWGHQGLCFSRIFDAQLVDADLEWFSMLPVGASEASW